MAPNVRTSTWCLLVLSANHYNHDILLARRTPVHNGMDSAGRPRVGNVAIHNVQYQFEVNRCRNEEVIVKGNFRWACSCGRGAPGLVMGSCKVEIDRIVIRDVQYQFEVNRCRNEETPRTFYPGCRFQGSSAYRRTDRRTDGRTAEITTISPRFSKMSIVHFKY
ncbi:hypothetical protein DPMN_123344 [Dreissena polymorpha]|uniref:Uncharacterized protein n=1 Tax=Dreissena polymorpha TaxID=45954 RepID=A0A9D4GU46_DREPO|nr:hypothetical protein DPMN_123344 [Dreissena polymorpha]